MQMYFFPFKFGKKPIFFADIDLFRLETISQCASAIYTLLDSIKSKFIFFNENIVEPYFIFLTKSI
jgi:hypothetical protein